MNYPERTEEEERERREAEDVAGESRMEQEREMKGRVMPTEEGMMNEQDKRVIYEWLYEELKGKAWELRQTFFGIEALPANAEELGFLPYIPTRKLPPLDMNTAFGECIPKLNTECVDVSCDSDFGWQIGTHDCYDTFYAALLDYIKAVQK